MKIMLDISYLGTAYCGWQVQPNAVSVQEKLQDAVQEVFGSRYDVTGCSRTDSGVHAKSFICTVCVDSNANAVPVARVPLALNSRLPDDIAVKSARIVPCDFHPRYSARGKEYEYIFCDCEFRNPLLLGRAAYVFPKLDEKAMNQAAAYFTGYHDFSAFMSSGSKITDARRTIFNCSVTRLADTVKLTVSADGFLYNMVRIIAGTLADVGHARLCPSDVKKIIDSGKRELAGKTMPAEGLYLSRVFYDNIAEGSEDNEEK